MGLGVSWAQDNPSLNCPAVPTPIRLDDSPEGPLYQAKVQDQDGLGTCYANALSLSLKSILPGHPDISYLDISVQAKASSLKYSPFYKNGDSTSSRSEVFVESGWATFAFNDLKKNGYCPQNLFPLERALYSEIKDPSIVPYTQEQAFRVVSEFLDEFKTYGNLDHAKLEHYLHILIPQFQEEIKKKARQSCTQDHAGLNDLRLIGANISDLNTPDYEKRQELIEDRLSDLQRRSIISTMDLESSLETLIKHYPDLGLNLEGPEEYNLTQIKDYLSMADAFISPEASLKKGLATKVKDLYQSIKDLKQEEDNYLAIMGGESEIRGKKKRAPDTSELPIFSADFYQKYDEILKKGKFKNPNASKFGLPTDLGDIKGQLQGLFVEEAIDLPNLNHLSNQEIISILSEDIRKSDPNSCVQEYSSEVFKDYRYLEWPDQCKDEKERFLSMLEVIRFAETLSPITTILNSPPLNILEDPTNPDLFLSFVAPQCMSDQGQRVALPAEIYSSQLSLEARPYPVSFQNALGESITKVSEALQRGEAPIFDFCSMIFNDPNLDTQFGNSTYCTSDDKHKYHAMTAIGIRCINGKVQFLFQNSWGNTCPGLTSGEITKEEKEKVFECEKQIVTGASGEFSSPSGKFWIDAEQMIKNTRSISFFGNYPAPVEDPNVKEKGKLNQVK